jgi:16S rRNA (cytidine1402-2'-O)-methyltransferase
VLYLVATPIGNLADITLRALNTLRTVDLIAAEDTRHSRILLQHHGIDKPLVSYHQHNEAMRTADLVQQLRNGTSIAVITDAGMPGISDPGMRLLKAAIQNEIPHTVLPGPSSIITAVAGSGLVDGPFRYRGFLPVKSGQRERELQAALAAEEPSVFLESPHRLLRSLETLATLDPERPLCVARELTKQFEEFRRGPAPQLLDHFSKKSVKGEFVLLVSGTDTRR